MKLKSSLLKASLSVSILLLSVFISFAQIEKPVTWNYSVKKTSDTDAELVFKAQIKPTWHLYSQFIPEGGPIPTSFEFKPSPAYSLQGKVIEGKTIKKKEPAFDDMELQFFENSGEFRQKIKINTAEPFIVKGTLEYMVCNEEMCLPPTKVDFEFKVSSAGASDASTDNSLLVSKGNGTCCSCDSIEALLQEYGVKTGNESTVTVPEIASKDLKIVADPLAVKLEEGCGDGAGLEEVDRSYWGIFLAGFAGGFLALLTPCVFPMIPLTVSFFTKRSKNRKKGVANASLYAASIIGIYVTLGFLITITLGPDALNAMASSAFFNLLFFVVFVIFAVSFFGAFEITLPSSFINKADAASEKGGVLGIFFMAFTLSLVSFSCTGPIIGTLLVEAAHGKSYLGPLIGMFGFALALALPFALFAAFPGWLNSLPKSGGWLNSVKVSLGFIELALALKFLSNVDLAYHWGFLKREIFIALWVVIFGLWGMYLIGKLRFSHDSEYKHTSIPGLVLALFVFTFTLYLVPGVWGAPLKMVSGYLPPSYYTESGEGGVHQCPHDLNCFHDFEEGMKYAHEVGKPVMIDFTGYSCVNCRRMEDNVWPDPQVLKRLKEDYVLISLYVDDKKELPADQKGTAPDGSKIETYGNKWSKFEEYKFHKNSQPYYVLLDNEGKILAQPRGYTPNVEEYVQFLDEGLCRYKKRVESGTAGR